MHDTLSMGRGDAGANRMHQFERADRRHCSLFCHEVLQRRTLHKFHHQKRHRATHDSKVSYSNDVLMPDRCGCQSFLAKAGNQIGIVADQIRKNDLDCVRSFQKDVTGLVNHAHATLAQTLLELVTAIKDGFAGNRSRGFRRVVRAVNDVVGETGTTGWTLFHPVVLWLSGLRASHSFGKILTAEHASSKEISTLTVE